MQALVPLRLVLLLSPMPLLTALNRLPDVPFFPHTDRRHTAFPLPQPEPPNNPLTPVPPPYDTDIQASSNAVVFSKYLYSSASTWSAKEIADHFRTHYVLLNQDGMLGDTLSIVYDMRLRDLQTSIKNARKMKEVVDILAAQHPTHS